MLQSSVLTRLNKRKALSSDTLIKKRLDSNKKNHYLTLIATETLKSYTSYNCWYIALLNTLWNLKIINKKVQTLYNADIKFLNCWPCQFTFFAKQLLTINVLQQVWFSTLLRTLHIGFSSSKKNLTPCISNDKY